MAWSQQGGRSLPADWARIRAKVLARDRRTCVLCGQTATEVDHVGNRDDHRLDNLRALCRRCHATRSARQGLAARWGSPSARTRRPPEPHPGLRPPRG